MLTRADRIAAKPKVNDWIEHTAVYSQIYSWLPAHFIANSHRAILQFSIRTETGLVRPPVAQDFRYAWLDGGPENLSGFRWCNHMYTAAIGDTPRICFPDVSRYGSMCVSATDHIRHPIIAGLFSALARITRHRRLVFDPGLATAAASRIPSGLLRKSFAWSPDHLRVLLSVGQGKRRRSTNCPGVLRSSCPYVLSGSPQPRRPLASDR